MNDTDRALVDPQVLCCLSADYVEIIQRLLGAGATRAESINRWGKRPEGMASATVAALLRTHFPERHDASGA